MNVHADIRDRTSRLTRADLDEATFRLAPPGECFDGMAMVRLFRLSISAAAEAAQDFERAAAALVGGLYGQGCALTFALIGSDREIQCWIGADRRVMEPSGLAAMIRGAFPDARLGLAGWNPAALNALKHAMVLTGTPNLSPASVQRDRLGGVCRALMGEPFLYVVSARPTEPSEVSVRIDEISSEIADVRMAYLMKATPTDEANRTAERYVSLLEANLGRLERGRSEGAWDVRACLYVESAGLIPVGRFSLQSAFSGQDSTPDPVRVRPCLGAVQADPNLEPLCSSELSLLVTPPCEDVPGLEITERARFGVEPSRVPTADALVLGTIIDRGRATGNSLAIARGDLARHGLIVGTTGAGKTNTCFNLLDQLWRGGAGIPFLVIEAAKTEYRQLLSDPGFADLRVFTVGDETTAPLRLNPFEAPAGTPIQSHIDYVNALFSAAFVLYPPMPYVLEQSIQEIYLDRGWDVADNTNRRGAEHSRAFPTLDDLAAKIPVVIDRMGYEARITTDVRAGLLARIDQLRRGGGKGRVLNTRTSVSADILFEKPCLLELQHIVNDAEKAFIMGLVLIRLYEHRVATGIPSTELAHVTLIEEAHRLLRSAPAGSGGDLTPNTQSQAIETFANVLSEIRAYGEGIVVAEQIPTKLAPDVVKNSGLKVVHRLTSPDDRALMSRAMNLDAPQERLLATLGVGEAVVATGRTLKPVLMEVPLAKAKTSAPPSPDALRTRVGPTPEFRLRHRACVACDPRRGARCSGWDFRRDRVSLLRAFRRAYNAMRLHPSSAPATLYEFSQLAKGDRWSASDPTPFCAFVAAAEFDLERRGEARGASHAEVGATIEAATAVARAAFDSSESPVTEAVADFERVPDLTEAPYAGCRSCARPCSFRYDMSQAPESNAAAFRAAFLSDARGMDELALVARSAAAGAYFLGDRASVDAAAYCFSVQQFAAEELSLSLYYQHQMAGLMHRTLVPTGGA